MPEKTKIPKVGGTRQSFYFQIITTPTVDTPGTSVLLHFANQRYFFGQIAEGTQRACIQRGVGVKKLQNLFLSGQTKWFHNGGLIGMILTMADVTRPENPSESREPRPRLNIHGGPKLLHTMACARRFVFRTGMPLTITEPSLDDEDLYCLPIHDDENIQVWGLPVRMQQHPTNGSEATEPDYFDVQEEIPNQGQSIQSRDASQYSERDVIAEQKLRKDTVTNMFDSDWRKDRLIEAPLREVKLPATVWVRDPVTKQLTSYNCITLESVPHLSPDTIVLVRNPWPASLVGELPDASNLPQNVSMSYVIKGQPQRGAFDPKKAISLGIKPGPNFGLLAAGTPVMAENGNLIQPEMVLGPTKPGRGIAIFDIPNPGYLADLNRKLQSCSGLMEGIESVVWIIGSALLKSAEFESTLQSMKTIKHILSHTKVCSNYLALDSSAMSSIRLASIAPQYFHLPLHDNRIDNFLSLNNVSHPVNLKLESRKDNEELELFAAQRGLKIQVEPQFVLQDDEIAHPLEIPKTEELLASEVKALLPSTTGQLPLTAGLRPYEAANADLGEPEIITLGTGSAVPSKYRNVSATLLRMPDGMGNYLFDCGENTLGQLRRIYTSQELDDVLVNLRAIWISHLHADHHLGTLSVLRQRRAAVLRRLESDPSFINDLRSRVCIMSEVNMIDFLNDFHSVEPFILTDAIWPIVCHPLHGALINGKYFEFQKHDIPIQDFRTARVSHCHGAQAVSITFANGFKFSYSGDCRPSEAFTKIGANSDILLHEATFDNGMEGDAMAKKHCTTGEALGVALKMKAKNVILTHFSQRYQKIPVLSNVKAPEEVQFEDGNPAEDSIAEPVEDGHDIGAASSLASEEPITQSRGAPSMALNKNEPAKELVAQGMHVCVAFDLMRVKVSEIATMQRYYPAIERMFEIEHEKSEQEQELDFRERNEAINRKKVKGQSQNLKSRSEITNGENIKQNGHANPTAKTAQEHDPELPIEGSKMSKNAMKREAKWAVDKQRKTEFRKRAAQASDSDISVDHGQRQNLKRAKAG